MIGGNASAEATDEAGVDDSGNVSGINVVMRHGLIETGFKNKKEYQTYLKVSKLW